MKFLSHKKIGENYLDRWHVFPRNPFFNILIHKFSGDDKSEELHDHPWPFVSILLRGGLLEERWLGNGWIASKRLPRFIPRYYPALHRHRLEMPHNQTKPAWTVVFVGPRFRLWGFYKRDGTLTKLMDDDTVVFEIPHREGIKSNH